MTAPVLPQEILLAEPRGFCAGVDRAIEIVEKALAKFGRPIYVRHEIVHNTYVVNDLKERGAIFIEELDDVPPGATLVFSAHGVSQAIQREAERRGFQIFDATCPLVTKVHVEVAKLHKEGYEFIMIGHKGHPEVEGTMGQLDSGIHLVEDVADVARVQPGQFQTSPDGRRVFFIDSHSDGERTGKNVFIVLTQNDQEAVITAQEGHVTTVKGQRFLNLTRGERSETNLATGEKVLARFEAARVLMGDAGSGDDGRPEPRALPTTELILSPDPKMRGELAWRLGMVWATLNMMLVGLALAAGNSRRSSHWNLVYALLVFVIYFNLLSMTQTWIGNRQLGLWSGLLGVHGGLSLLALLRIWWRDGGPQLLLKGRA